MSNTTRLASFLPYQLSITSNAVSTRISDEYRQRFGLKIPEWRVMCVLGDTGGKTQRELTQLTVMDKVAVNRACKTLEDRGLAQRMPNSHDGRSHTLELTESGQEMFAQIMPLATEMERRLMSGFSEEECNCMRSMLSRLRDQVDDLDAADIDSGNFGIS
ncbi:MarR family winged helix-turn-helix transcriptional regulator [Altericroceibacterium endophyticum]|uniref:MarR family transcriptional regulator n=1 Tax=Altericroceibacterium endophyticum TaxID=1808508 RepID=A0A6I4T8C6_9SPHN|nr:MarR family winged helix-turn-helix transcriptional regulator [Altericroceibacterium endophyticum]MXO66512.1 MarR family transcriptional regulator [Altericroceibacterium endophyticum]